MCETHGVCSLFSNYARNKPGERELKRTVSTRLNSHISLSIVPFNCHPVHMGSKCVGLLALEAAPNLIRNNSYNVHCTSKYVAIRGRVEVDWTTAAWNYSVSRRTVRRKQFKKNGRLKLSLSLCRTTINLSWLTKFGCAASRNSFSFLGHLVEHRKWVWASE